jgi:chemotaxis protein histidine kinase CheA
VKVARENILQTIEIDKLVRNLNRTDDLLHIAACGVAGFVNPTTSESLSAQVMGLQYKVRKSTGEMGSALLRFGQSAGQMLPILHGAFKDLYSLYEADCLTRLARCATVATEMATTSDTLKGTFDGLADEAQKIAQGTTQTRDLREKAREAAIARQKEIEKQQAETEETKKYLETQIPQVRGWYEEAKAAQNTADGRMFTMAIVGSVTKALGDGIAAGLQFKAAPALAGAQLATALANKTVPPPKEEKKTDEKSEKTSEVLTAESAYRVAKEALTLAEGNYKKAQEKTTNAQTTFDKLKGPYKKARDESEEAKKGTDDAKAKKKAYEEVKGPYDEAETALEKATEAEESAKTALETAQEKEKAAKTAKDKADASAPAAGVAAGLSSAGASAQDAASAYAEIAANYGREKTKYLDMLMDLQKQERAALGAIAKFAKEMETERGVEQLEQAAVESLHIAVGVLKTVVVILQDVTQFWTQMAVACRQLAGTELRTDIEIYMKRPRQARIKEYSNPDFILRLLLVAAKWRALKLVANEYRIATMKVYEKLGETYKKNLPIAEARAEAKRLAKQLEGEVQKEIQKSEAVTAQIETAKTDAQKLIAAAA